MNKEAFPSFVCPKCGKSKELAFDPRNDYDSWLKFKCTKCNYSPMDNTKSSTLKKKIEA